MTTRMSGMSGTSGRRSMWLAVACLMAMTSTLSAQVEKASGPAGPSASQGSAGSVSVGNVGTTLSGQGTVQVQPPYAGTCGTDTTPQREHVLHHVRAHLMVVLFQSGMHMFPGHLALQLAAYQLWIQSTIDVLPPL